MKLQIFQSVALCQGLVLGLVEQTVFEATDQSLKITMIGIEKYHSEK